MSLPSRLLSHAWLIIPLCAIGFIAWTDYGRVRRVEYVADIDREEAVVDSSSPTGYAGGKRWLIVPEHNNHSYQWIAETQQMLARKEWRVRSVDYENAPFGREVHSASPYRWWLGLVAWVNHRITGQPPGIAVERAALYADPGLHLLMLVGTTIFVARQFGTFPAALLSLGLATLFPLAASFLPGAPENYGLAQVCAFWSVLPLLAGVAPTRPRLTDRTSAEAEVARAGRRLRDWFIIAGVAGGLGLWISTANQVPIVGGIALGGILAAWIARDGAKANRGDARAPLPWRAWALGGATTCLLAYLIEYYPAHMDWRLEENHPLYGLAWLGVGELLARMAPRLHPAKPSWNLRNSGMALLAVMAVAALPVAMAWSKTQAFLTADLMNSRLTILPSGVVAKNLAAWIRRDGPTPTLFVTCLPLLLLGPAAWLLARRNLGVDARRALAIAFGPVLITLLFAFGQIRWWSMFDTTLLGLVVACMMAPSTIATAGRRWFWSAWVGLVFMSGLLPLFPSMGRMGKNDFTRLEVVGLIERALAHWITDHAGPSAVILAPPECTASLGFYGGLRGLGTPTWENHDGVAATVRIVSATTGDEALALLNQRGVTHLVIPSWDADLDEFVRWTLKRPEDSFLSAVHQWALPPFLRPWPYKLPAVAGFEDQSVVLLEVTNESDRATSLSRLAEYFIEMQQIDLALSAGQSLRLYPANLGALVALARVEKAYGDAAAYDQVFSTLLANLAGGLDRTLPWDRRVSLAIVLAQGNRNDLARKQLQRCLENLDEGRLRSLTTASVFGLQLLGKAFDLPIPDARLRELAQKQVPAELRDRL